MVRLSMRRAAPGTSHRYRLFEANSPIVIQVMSVREKVVRLGHGGFIHTRGSSIERA
jgi:hypothetical protein